MTKYTVDSTANQELTEAQRLILVEYGHTVTETPPPPVFTSRIGTAPGWSGGGSRITILGRPDGTLRLEAESMGDAVGLTMDSGEAARLRDGLSQWLTVQVAAAWKPQPDTGNEEITTSSPEPDRALTYIDVDDDLWRYEAGLGWRYWTDGRWSHFSNNSWSWSRVVDPEDGYTESFPWRVFGG